MCFKKILEWFKPDPIPQPPNPPEPPTDKKRIALLFAINNYPGTTNDLNGCINDQIDLSLRLAVDFPGFQISMFKDAEVTRSRFIKEVVSAIAYINPGDVLLVHYSGHGTKVTDVNGDEKDGYDEALYLYDGTVIDDDIGYALKSIPDGATVVLMFDSCFSGTVTRTLKNQNRFIPNPNIDSTAVKRIRIPKEEMKWIVFSGCQEDQTSADATFNGRFNGAFTYYSLKALKPNMTYAQWIVEINKYLPSGAFDQCPTLEGNQSLFSNIVFT